MRAASAGMSKPPSRYHVGEVGRVLLSSTMLGNDAALAAARRHMFEVPVPVALAPPSEEVMSSDSEMPKRKNKKKSKKKPASNKTTLASLHHDIRSETEKFITACGENEEMLSAQLDHLRAITRFNGKNPDNSSHSSPSSRWFTPKESGYDSDSTSTTTTDINPVEDLLGKNVSSASRYLKGRAQEKLLSQARAAISRAANLCQLLADPEQPGALERRELLIRAFRAIETGESLSTKSSLPKTPLAPLSKTRSNST